MNRNQRNQYMALSVVISFAEQCAKVDGLVPKSKRVASRLSARCGKTLPRHSRRNGR